MYFLLRDDDTCGFTDPHELFDCYENIWDKFPVNLSVTPFRIPGNTPTVPEKYRHNYNVLPLSENRPLVELLLDSIKKGRVNIALHGYNHTKPRGLPEYAAAPNLDEKTRKGKEYLEETLQCEIDTFVPPNNTIWKKGLTAIIKNRLNLVGIPSILSANHRQLKPAHFVKYIIVKYYHLLYNGTYPYVLDICGHKEVSYSSLTPSQSLERLKQRFELTYKLKGVFILSVHYHAFNKRLNTGETISDVMYYFLEKVSNLKDIKVVTYKDLWSERTKIHR